MAGSLMCTKSLLVCDRLGAGFVGTSLTGRFYGGLHVANHWAAMLPRTLIAIWQMSHR
jgi:hypothetical protein